MADNDCQWLAMVSDAGVMPEVREAKERGEGAPTHNLPSVTLVKHFMRERMCFEH